MSGLVVWGLLGLLCVVLMAVSVALRVSVLVALHDAGRSSDDRDGSS